MADLMSLAILAIARLRNAHRLRFSVVVTLAFAFAQVAIEGPRWQMVPAYGLTLLLVVAMASCFSNAATPTGWRWRARSAVGAGVVGLAVSVALPLIVPVFGLPPPTGSYAIGTLTFHWIDTARPEVFAADSRARRELMVLVWYPGPAQTSGARAAYLPDAGAVTAAFARIQQLPAFIFGHLQYVTTNAMASAPAASGLPGYPVLLFLEGATGFRQMNTFQVELLASHGYIVVAIDQPGAAAAVVFPDGHQVAGLNLAQFQATVGPSYMPRETGSPKDGILIPPGLAGQGGGIIAYLAGDVTFVLDQLIALNQSDPNRILTGKLDLQRVGVFGVSLGGIVVGEACLREPRLRACLMMDAPMSSAVVDAGLRRPSMWITRDAAGMRLERQRAGGWSEAEIEAHQSSMRAVYEGVAGPGYFVSVPGTFHSNFTDIARWTPMASLLGIAGPIDARRAHDIINAYSLAFFDRHLRGRAAGLIDELAKRYPEAIFESHAP